MKSLTEQDESKSLPIPLAVSNCDFVYLGSGSEGLSAARHGVAAPPEALTTSPTGVCGNMDKKLKQRGEALHHLPTGGAPNTEGFLASRMESMVDDLIRPEVTKSVGKRSSLPQDPAAATGITSPTAQAFGDRGSPALAPPLNAQDLLHRMHQSTSASQPSPNVSAINFAPLPSILRTPFAPRPGETPESPRPTSSHHVLQGPPFSDTPSSSANFQADLTRLEDQIQQQTSPQSSFHPTTSGQQEASLNLNPWVRAPDNFQPPPSPWRSAFPGTGSTQQTPTSTRAPATSQYGAIGESRPRSSRKPNNGQPD